MIITTEITIKVNPSNLINLGKYLTNVKSGDIVKIPVEYLTKSSHIKITVECDICKIQKEISYRSYYNSFTNGGYYSCSQKCSKSKAINTNIRKYGVDNPAKSSVIKCKIKKSFNDKYGVNNISYLPEIVDRIKTSVNMKTSVS